VALLTRRKPAPAGHREQEQQAQQRRQRRRHRQLTKLGGHRFQQGRQQQGHREPSYPQPDDVTPVLVRPLGPVAPPIHTGAMAYDEELAERVRNVLEGEPGLTEKHMFGGCAFLLDGNMAVSASGQGGLLLRVPPGETSSMVDQPGASRFRMRGREMDGWLHLDSAAIDVDDDLRRWVSLGVRYARSLPPK
jgi:TfoX N-terminal domain